MLKVTGTFYVYDDEGLAKKHINPTIFSRLEKTKAKIAEAEKVEAPAEEKTVEAPAEEKTVEAPAEEKTVEAPAEEKTVEAPAEEKTE
jgi:hypothetical protein